MVASSIVPWDLPLLQLDMDATGRAFQGCRMEVKFDVWKNMLGAIAGCSGRGAIAWCLRGVPL